MEYSVSVSWFVNVSFQTMELLEKFNSLKKDLQLVEIIFIILLFFVKSVDLKNCNLEFQEHWILIFLSICRFLIFCFVVFCCVLIYIYSEWVIIWTTIIKNYAKIIVFSSFEPMGSFDTLFVINNFYAIKTEWTWILWIKFPS